MMRFLDLSLPATSSCAAARLFRYVKLIHPPRRLEGRDLEQGLEAYKATLDNLNFFGRPQNTHGATVMPYDRTSLIDAIRTTHAKHTTVLVQNDDSCTKCHKRCFATSDAQACAEGDHASCDTRPICLVAHHVYMHSSNLFIATCQHERVIGLSHLAELHFEIEMDD